MFSPGAAYRLETEIARQRVQGRCWEHRLQSVRQRKGLLTYCRVILRLNMREQRRAGSEGYSFEKCV